MRLPRGDTSLKELDPIALELGRIIMDWALLDGLLSDLVIELSHIDEPTVSDIVCGDIDLIPTAD